MDLNGDGMSDLLRIVKASCQLSVRHRVFLSKGDGTFFEPLTPFNPEISFEDKKSVYTPPQPGAKPCNQPDVPPGPPSGSPGTALPAPGDLDPSPLPTCGSYRSYSTGKRYYLLDVNGDGLIDIINTVFPGFTSETAIRTPLAERCSNPTAFNFSGEVQEPIVCTRIFLNKGDGEFGEHPDGAHPNRHDVS